MNTDFEISSTCKAVANITAFVYNDNIDEVITVGQGFITVSMLTMKGCIDGGA